jgi:pyridoxamine 5'-phosphate oxidase-like protein
MTQARQLQALSRQEALCLLAGVSLGRVVFTHRALPAIRPVNHLVEDERIIVRTGQDSALARAVDIAGRSVVAYEADMIHPDEHVGWSVIVVGRASHLADEEAAQRYRRALRPWVPGPLDDIIVIQAEIVDGFRLTRHDGG